MERHVRAGAGGECDDHSVPSELPVLYKEADGSSVLKFSELFAPLRAVDPLNGQMHPRALRKRYLRMIRLQARPSPLLPAAPAARRIKC